MARFARIDSRFPNWTPLLPMAFQGTKNLRITGLRWFTRIARTLWKYFFVFLWIDSRESIRANRPASCCESPGHLCYRSGSVGQYLPWYSGRIHGQRTATARRNLFTVKCCGRGPFSKQFGNIVGAKTMADPENCFEVLSIEILLSFFCGVGPVWTCLSFPVTFWFSLLAGQITGISLKSYLSLHLATLW